MSDLNKKLKEIQSEIGCCSYHMESKEFRDSIKQAFIDDGWRKHQPFSEVTGGRYAVVEKAGEKLYTISGIDELTFYDGTKLKLDPEQPIRMTGQEWYDKFQREYHYLMAIPESTYIDSTATLAAKKAAGIESAKESE